jgi:hypothetical protein
MPNDNRTRCALRKDFRYLHEPVPKAMKMLIGAVLFLNSLRKRSGRRKQGDGHYAEMQSGACRGYWV